MPGKPVILFFQFDLMSHFFRALKLADELKDHYKVYIRQTDKYADWLEQSKLESFKCIDFNPEESLKKLGNYDFSWLNDKALEKIFLEQVKVIKKYKPKIVIGDMSFTLKMAAEATGVPYISILNGYFTKHYKLTRELSPTHYIEKYINWIPNFLLHPIVRFKEAQNFNLILKEFNKVREKYNLHTSRNYLEEIEGNHNLICDLPEIFPQKNLPNNFHIIGPLINHSLKNGEFDQTQINPAKKTILITLGSLNNWSRFNFLNKKEFANYNIIAAGEGSNMLSASFILKTSFVNFPELLPKVDLVICHGGNGTLLNALAHNIPVLCLPYHPEQFWNVKRIEKLGYGKSLEKVNSKKYTGLIKNWIERKDKINWELSFNKYNKTYQNNVINEIAENILQNN